MPGSLPARGVLPLLWCLPAMPLPRCRCRDSGMEGWGPVGGGSGKFDRSAMGKVEARGTVHDRDGEGMGGI